MQCSMIFSEGPGNERIAKLLAQWDNLLKNYPCRPYFKNLLCFIISTVYGLGFLCTVCVGHCTKKVN